MSDLVTIFNRAGSAIALFTDLHVNRSWRLRDSSQITFRIAKTHIKATAVNLAYGNRILIENSSLSMKWVGFIWPPRDEDESSFSVTAQSAERLFFQRISNTTNNFSGTAGAIASSLVTNANSIEATGVTLSASDVDSSGASFNKTYHLTNIFEALTKLAEESNFFWWVSGSRNASTGILDMSFKWSAARGITWPHQLEQGWNFQIDSCSEEGSPISSATVYGKGKANDWSDVPVATVTNATALATYGLVQAAYASLNSEDINTVTAVATATATQNGKLRRDVNGVVTQAPFPSIGDTVSVKLKRFAFGAELTMLVYDCAWDSLKNNLVVKLRET